jgi:hypothetical protein
MLLLREWVKDVPKDASIRIDVPPSGNQLWAQYMMSARRLGSPYPLIRTTYARMPFSVAGDYVLTPRYLPSQTMAHRKVFPKPPYAGAIVDESYSFILRKLHMPAKYRDTSSGLMVQP